MFKKIKIFFYILLFSNLSTALEEKNKYFFHFSTEADSLEKNELYFEIKTISVNNGYALFKNSNSLKSKNFKKTIYNPPMCISMTISKNRLKEIKKSHSFITQISETVPFPWIPVPFETLPINKENPEVSLYSIKQTDHTIIWFIKENQLDIQIVKDWVNQFIPCIVNLPDKNNTNK